ncbi:MAG: glycosyltransferase family 25 protein [Verrucomicrobiae bacterium]|nr:glycosyltransferase family 25 protein [Verrucomicrobiae bacterium]
MSAPVENPWDYFPLAMCITLKERPERQEEARQELRRVGLKKVVFYRSERQKDVDKGCLDSHLACLDYAVRQGAPHVLIFEDDVLFQENHQENMKRIVTFLQEHQECDFLSLGSFIFGKAEKIGKHFLRGSFMCLQSYVVRADWAEKLVANRPPCPGFSSDTYFTIMNRNRAVAHVYPPATIQRPSASDGSWDSRSLAKSGWLGNAILYTSLDLRDRLRFNHFSIMERIRIENGKSFFRVFKLIKGLQLARSRRRMANPDQGPLNPPGEFIIESL